MARAMLAATEIRIMANDRRPWGPTIALDVYCASLKGKPAQVLDGLTGNQHVFLGWPQA